MEVQTLGSARGTMAGRGTGDSTRREQWRRATRRFRQNPVSVVGLGLIVFVLLVALVGPFVVPYPGDATGALHIAQRLLPPSTAHWFGTDDVGRDIFTRVIVGSRISLQVGVTVLIVATSIGVTLGALAGYLGGRLDELVMRVTDVFLTVPGLILAMAVAAALGPSLRNVMVAISLVWWPGYCRLTRASVLAVKELPYVESARAIGVGRARILVRHVMPNVVSPIVVKASMDLGFAILTTASLGFIGLGAQPPTPDWGVMIADGRKFLQIAWWYATFPGLAIFITVLGFNLLGDGLRDVFDPHGRGSAA